MDKEGKIIFNIIEKKDLKRKKKKQHKTSKEELEKAKLESKIGKKK